MSILGVSVPREDVVRLARRLNCKEETLPFRYLGLPVGGNMNVTKNWQPLVDKFRNKFSAWKAKSLSIGGRLCLCKAVLGTLGTFMFSLYKAPKKVLGVYGRSTWRDKTEPDAQWRTVVRGCNGIHVPRHGTWRSILRVENDLRELGINISTHLKRKDDDGGWVWDLDNSKMYIVRSLRTLIDGITLPIADMETNWVRWLPGKVNIQLWRVLNNRLPTRDNLQNRGMNLNSILCPLCLSTAESLDHLLCSCSTTKTISAYLLSWVDWWPTNDQTVVNMWDKICSSGVNMLQKDVCKLIGAAYFNSIWTSRNNKIFNGGVKAEKEIFRDIQAFAFNWVAAAPSPPSSMAAGDSSKDTTLPLATILHMLTIKLSSTNYLLWKNQILPLFSYQKLIGHVDGSLAAPSTTITIDGKTSPNPEYATWQEENQRALLILQSSLTEEAMAEVLGLHTAHEVWHALESAYSHDSVERMQNLRDSLRQLQKGASSVTEYGRKFKSLCDQLAAIGQPVDDADKTHWFLCGLGPSFETFSTAHRAVKPRPGFRDLLSQAEGHELFLKSVHGSSTSHVAFTAESGRSYTPSNRRNSGRGGRGGGRSGGRGRGRRLPHCQLCRQDGHYANRCPDLNTFAQRGPSIDANLAQAFHEKCNVHDNSSDWFVDSGASAHMTPSTATLDSSMPYTGNDHNRRTKDILARGRCDNGLYVLEQGHKALMAGLKSNRLRASYELWHNRLGHVAFETISLLNKLGHLFLTSVLPKPSVCTSCELSKSHKLPFAINEKRSLHVLDMIHCDLWGPSPVMSTDGYLYYALFVDDFSRFTWFYPMKHKSDFFQVLAAFLRFVQTQFSCKVKVFQSDGGTEFTNHRVRSLLVENGTHHRLSCPYTPQQNGRAERKHRHITETGLAMLFNANAPSSLWVDAFSSAVYIVNRLPSKVMQSKSPFELLFNNAPNYNVFRTFGCRVFPYLRNYTTHKLAPRSVACVFIGYSSQYKGYRCLDMTTSRIFTTRHAKFDESTFPFSGNVSSVDLAQLVFSHFEESPSSLPAQSKPSDPIFSAATNSSSASGPCSLCPDMIYSSTAPAPSGVPPMPSPASSAPSGVPPMPPPASSAPSAAPMTPPPPSAPASSSLHPMTTRSRAGIFKPRHFADLASLTSSPVHVVLFAHKEPKGFKSAAKHPKWLEAMNEEMSALRNNNTWDLVPRPVAFNVVGSKWVFAPNIGLTAPSIAIKLACPVVKASTVRIVLSLAVLNNWPLRQLDVKNAFLHGHLNETVFMEQPPGFVDSQYPNHVCRLKKALYGLKQAPRAWFQRLSSFLTQLGFTCSRADTSLFVFRRNSCILYLLVYVDDIILTGNNNDFIAQFVSRLHKEFAIKDLGKLSYFLGLEASYTNDGLFLTQAKYAHDILSRAGLLDTKPVSTPLTTSSQLVSHGDAFSDPTLYRSLVGALQYLTITRPDLSYAVNQVSQFFHAPTVNHFQAVKRILRYVKGTLSFGLTFKRSPNISVVAYSDADWARCIETRRSTYGYSIFLGGTIVSWSAKKQPTVSRSSCESEYRALANTASEVVWITSLLRDLHVFLAAPPTLLCDNKSAIFLSQNPASHKRAKHIDIDYHFVRELVSLGRLTTRFVPTTHQLADIFTKSLPHPLFEHFRCKLCVGSPPPRLKGGISNIFHQSSKDCVNPNL
ncbi:hypothetical protein OSB04_016405 [Centaurea solstitialis]|uniref:Integrase catalytic domain-containing protein n=1 Tax=Centaurea solstitialis TaxID=347529 RepID=A0AA38T0W2_9ASTR|nr:hypothetical protein OSB04_016405 [Centaurea solstitialis]